MNIPRDIQKLLSDLTEIVIEDLRKQIKIQGHVNTGKGLRSLRYVVRDEGNGKYTTDIYWLDYMGIINDGVPASRIPYTPSKRTGARISKYIQGLMDYFRSRGLNERESKSAAFATARVHSREGLPTRASKRFSSSGDRTGMVETVIEKRGAAIVRFAGLKGANLFEVNLKQRADEIFAA